METMTDLMWRWREWWSERRHRRIITQMLAYRNNPDDVLRVLEALRQHRRGSLPASRMIAPQPAREAHRRMISGCAKTLNSGATSGRTAAE